VHDSGWRITSIRLSLWHWPSIVKLLLLFVAVTLGCGERNSSSRVQESNLRVVAVLYSQFVSAHEHEIPRDAEDFKSFVQSLGPGVLERAGLSGIDELLLSNRDSKPFFIHYKNTDWKLKHVIAYEQEGAGGTRCIASDLGAVSEISDEQFQNRLKDSM